MLGPGEQEDDDSRQIRPSSLARAGAAEIGGRAVAEDQQELPRWFRMLIIGAFAATLVAHIVIDAYLDDYEGASVSLMLGGVVGTALGVNEYLRGRGGG